MRFDDVRLRAYRGGLPYAFLSYSHKDKEDAERITRELIDRGFRVWFDEGLTPAKEWDEVIANRVENCGYFIALISRNYLESENCRDELNYARDKNRPRMLIYLEDVELPGGMAMRLLRNHALHKWEYADTAQMIDKAVTAEGIDVCRNTDRGPEQTAGPDRQPAPKPKKRAGKAWRIVAAAVCLIASFAILFLVLNKTICASEPIVPAVTEPDSTPADPQEQTDAQEMSSGPANNTARMEELAAEWETADTYFAVEGIRNAVFYDPDGLTQRILMKCEKGDRMPICADYRFTWDGEQIRSIERYDTAGELVVRHTFSYSEGWLTSDTIAVDGTVTGNDGEVLEQDGANGATVLFPEEGIVTVKIFEDRTHHDTYYEESMTIYPDGFVFFIGGSSNRMLTIYFNQNGQLTEDAYMVGDPSNAKYYDKHWYAID